MNYMVEFLVGSGLKIEHFNLKIWNKNKIRSLNLYFKSKCVSPPAAVRGCTPSIYIYIYIYIYCVCVKVYIYIYIYIYIYCVCVKGPKLYIRECSGTIVVKTDF